MPSRSIRRYSACRDRPRSLAACASTPPARSQRGLDRGAIGFVGWRGRRAAARRQAEIGRRRASLLRQQRARWIVLRSSRTLPGQRCAQQRAFGVVAELLARGQEVPRQRQDVVGALGQRRQLQFDRVEPVVEVLAELAGADQRRQVGVGRADHAHLDLALAVAAQALEAAGLEHAQQLHLPGRRQRADLVEEQRAAVGGLELALARALRAGVGAGLGAEQFGLDQLATAARRS